MYQYLLLTEIAAAATTQTIYRIMFEYGSPESYARRQSRIHGSCIHCGVRTHESYGSRFDGPGKRLLKVLDNELFRAPFVSTHTNKRQEKLVRRDATTTVSQLLRPGLAYNSIQRQEQELKK